jgi:hypothetical protein
MSARAWHTEVPGSGPGRRPRTRAAHASIRALLIVVSGTLAIHGIDRHRPPCSRRERVVTGLTAAGWVAGDADGRHDRSSGGSGPRCAPARRPPSGAAGGLSPTQQHVVAPSPAAMTALIALTQADAVLAWDPADRTLIAANLVGTMPWTERARPSLPARPATGSGSQ